MTRNIFIAEETKNHYSLGGGAVPLPGVSRRLIVIVDLQNFPKRFKTKTKLHGLSPRANYTDRATAACRRSDCQLLRIEGATCTA
jgi:hypothetical protein